MDSGDSLSFLLRLSGGRVGESGEEGLCGNGVHPASPALTASARSEPRAAQLSLKDSSNCLPVNDFLSFCLILSPSLSPSSLPVLIGH